MKNYLKKDGTLEKKYSFQSDGFFTKNDKGALADSLEKTPLGKSEKRVILHGKTRLTLENSKHGFKVGKAVDGGSTYLYSSYFEKK